MNRLFTQFCVFVKSIYGLFWCLLLNVKRSVQYTIELSGCKTRAKITSCGELEGCVAGEQPNGFDVNNCPHLPDRCTLALVKVKKLLLNGKVSRSRIFPEASRSHNNSALTIIALLSIVINAILTAGCGCPTQNIPSVLDPNLKVVDLRDLNGNLPLNAVSTAQILWQTEDWEVPTWKNPGWPKPNYEDSVGYPTVVKNDKGINKDNKYYLYYAHHNPSSGIGVAVADAITGPYSKVNVPGRQDNLVVTSFQYPAHHESPDHNSSPSVVWNEDEQLWFMYFHYYNHFHADYVPHLEDPDPAHPWPGPGKGDQMTALATTPDLASHNWTVWEDPTFGTAPPYRPVFTTTDGPWMDSQSSYHAIQRLPDGQWLAFLRGTSTDGTFPKLGFATSNDGRNWNYFPENPVIHQGAEGNGGKVGVYRPGFVGYLGKDADCENVYLVSWSEADSDSNLDVIYARTKDFKTFVRNPAYATWSVADGIVSPWREGDNLYLFTGKNLHIIELP